MKVSMPRIPLPTEPAFQREIERMFRSLVDAVNDSEVRSGPTADRPVGADLRPGRLYNDVTLNKLIRYSGSGWTNVDGTAL